MSLYPTRETAFAVFSFGSSNVNVLGIGITMMKRFIRRIFRYKLSALFLIVGQLIMFGTIFGGLAIYNKAYDKETERIKSKYKNEIELTVTTINYADIFSNMGYNITEGNVHIGGKLAFSIADSGMNYLTEIIIKQNEPLPYKLLSGRLPGTEAADKGKKLAAVGRDKLKFTREIDGKRYIFIGSEQYEVVGILGDENSDFWDYKLVLHIDCAGENLIKTMMEDRNYTVYVSSNIADLNNSYTQVCSNIGSIEPQAKLSAKKINSLGDSTVISTLQKNNFKINLIVYAFCVVNSMIISEFLVIQRKKEIVIKKTFGMSNAKILKSFMADILSLTGLSFVLMCIVYAIFHHHNLFFINNIYSFFAMIFVVLFVIICTMIYPIYKLLKIEPIEAFSQIE